MSRIEDLLHNARAQLDAGRIVSALAATKEALGLDPDHPGAQALLTDCDAALEERRRKKADDLKQLEEASTASPSDLPAPPLPAEEPTPPPTPSPAAAAGPAPAPARPAAPFVVGLPQRVDRPGVNPVFFIGLGALALIVGLGYNLLRPGKSPSTDGAPAPTTVRPRPAPASTPKPPRVPETTSEPRPSPTATTAPLPAPEPTLPSPPAEPPAATPPGPATAPTVPDNDDWARRHDEEMRQLEEERQHRDDAGGDEEQQRRAAQKKIDELRSELAMLNVPTLVPPSEAEIKRREYLEQQLRDAEEELSRLGDR